LVGLAGLSALVAWTLYEFTDPEYYEAASFTDYVSVVSLTVVFVATGIALILLWRDPPVARGSLFLLFAGIGAAAEGLGNLFEDAFDIEAAVWAFFGGGLVMMYTGSFSSITARMITGTPAATNHQPTTPNSGRQRPISRGYTPAPGSHPQLAASAASLARIVRPRVPPWAGP
jgi:hypothetical protein